MFEKLKAIKFNVTLTALLSVILGIIFIFWPGQTVMVISKVLAALIVLAGVINLTTTLLESERKTMGIVVSVIVAILGIWLFMDPAILVKVIPVVVGVLLVLHGVQDVQMAFEGKANQAERWYSILIMGILNILFGILAIAFAFGIVKLGMMILGIMLVYDGLSDMLIVHKVNKAAKEVVDSTIVHEENVDDN